MASIRVGYRRLYDSMGCSIANQQIVHVVFPFGKHLQVEIYIGNNPKFGIWTETGHEDYLIPGEQMTIGHYTYHADATQSPYPRKFFTEIICSQVEEVSDELFEAFYREDSNANQELLGRAQAHAEEYYMIADLLSGVIGLRFHPQFIMKLLNENFIAFHDEKRAINYAGSPVQNLEAIQLIETGISAINQLFPEIGKVDNKETKKASQVLGWLIRAWTERDIISKFNALFIPLEMILEGVQGKMPEAQRRQVEKIQTLIDTRVEEDREKEALRRLLDRLVKNQRPSLIDRFDIFAKQAKMPGWMNDIEAFKKFNRIRNGLIHSGDPKVGYTYQLVKRSYAL